MSDRRFMVLWGLTLFAMGLALVLLFLIKGQLSANHEILTHIAQMHLK